MACLGCAIIAFGQAYQAENGRADRVPRGIPFVDLHESAYHSPISITENAALDTFPDKAGGNGSSWDEAYIIENFSTESIRVANTTRYLVIRNCSLENSTAFGIELVNCTNTRVELCNATGKMDGIHLEQSSAIVIENCTITGSTHYGIFVHTSPGCVIVNSSACYNAYGIVIDAANSCTVSRNDASHNNYNGVALLSSDGCIVEHVTANSNGAISVRADNSDDATIRECTVISSLDCGIVVNQETSVTVVQNIVTNHPGIGVQIHSNNGCNISRNVIADCGEGIELFSSDGCTVSGNNITLNTVGYALYLYLDQYCTFSSNQLVRSGYGIYADQIYYNTFYGNNCSSNSNTGFFIWSSDANTFTQNIVEHNTVAGFHAGYSYYNYIYLNMFSANQYNGRDQNGYSYWDNGTFGNFWGDYQVRYPAAINDDLIWSTPYQLYLGSVYDNHPIVFYFDPGKTGRIIIDGNADLAANADGGNGTQGSPYVIRDRHINALKYSTCLSISNTDKFLVISNCTLRFSGWFGFNAGLLLVNCSNVNVTGCTVSNCYYEGIYAINCTRLWISNTTSRSSNIGLHARNVDNCTIQGNEITMHYMQNIFLETCTNTSVSDNNVSISNYFGLYMSNCDRLLIKNNSIVGIMDRAIYILLSTRVDLLQNNATAIHDTLSIDENCRWITISGNTLEGGGLYAEGSQPGLWSTMSIDGTNTVNGNRIVYYYNTHGAAAFNFTGAGQIIVANCTGAIISNMTISSVSSGLCLYYCDSITVHNITTTGNQIAGIFINTISNCNITGNTIESNAEGMLVYYSESCTFRENRFCYNSFSGAYFIECFNLTISANNASGNGDINVVASGCINCSFSGNFISHNGYSRSFSMDSSINNSICDNFFSGLDILTIIMNSNNTIIQNNTFNGGYGLVLEGSFSTLVNANRVFNSYYGINVRYGGGYNRIVNNNITDAVERPLIIDSSGFNTIESNKVTRGNYGIYLSGAYNNSIRFNTLASNDYNGIFIRGNGNIVEYNGISGSSQECILLSSGNFNRIITRQAMSGAREIVALVNSHNNTITETSITGGPSSGIKLSNSHNNTIAGNNITKMAASGIVLVNSNGCLVESNNLSSNTLDGLSVSGGSYCTLRNNMLILNRRGGISLVNVNYADILRNVVVNDTMSGISVTGSGSTIHENYVNYQQDIYSGSSSNKIYANFYLLEDTDGDGLLGWEEYAIGTNPSRIDSDNDNFLDGYEHQVGTDPTNPLDTPLLPEVQYDAIVAMLDGNMTLVDIVLAFVEGNWTYLQQTHTQLLSNMSTIEAVLNQLDDIITDRDGDGLADVNEIAYGTDPLRIDTDLDNLDDAFEIRIGTNPVDDDTDGDGILDGIEVARGSDPLDASSVPGNSDGNQIALAAMTGALTGGLTAFAVALLVKFRSSRARKPKRDVT